MKAKKVLAMLMASAMIMGTTVTAFAADNIIGNSDDTGTITVSGIKYEAGITVTAYPIIKAVYNNNDNSFSGYETLYPGIIDATPDTQRNINVTLEELNQVLAKIKSGQGSTTSYQLTDENQDGSYVSENILPVGSYLVVIEGAEEKIYNPVVASISYGTENGSNDLKDDEVNVITDGTSWTKVSSNPTIEKTVSDDDGDVDEEGKGNSAAIGETVYYEVDINPVPYYGGDYPVLNVVDTLSAGLTYNNDLKVYRVTKNEESVETEVELSANEYYDLTYNDINKTITVNFVKDTTPNVADDGKNYTLNSFAGEVVRIKYSATVNENAVVNAGGNNNDVTLNYTQDSKVTGDEKEDKDKTYTYTFDIDGATTKQVITKTGEGNESLALEGAKFKLYTDEKCTNEYHNSKYDKGLNDGYLVSTDEGQLYMTGLEAGKYWLKEEAAPEPYTVNTHVFAIEIKTEYNDNGTLKNWKVTIDGVDVKTFTVKHDAPNGFEASGNGLDIKNTKISNLPSTGGIGTTIFTIGELRDHGNSSRPVLCNTQKRAELIKSF